MAKVQHKRGLKANLPSSALNAGEIFITTDRQTIHAAKDATTMIALTPAVEDLTTLGSIDATNDLVMIHDVSEATAQKEKKVTIAALKAAFNIPAASSDEKVAVVSGGTSGFIFGTDGTNGVVRVDNSMTMTKDAGNGFVTLSCVGLDCGTF